MAEVRELSIGNNVYDIESKSVVDQNTGKLKFWSGTKAEYDAQKLPAGTYYAWETQFPAMEQYYNVMYTLVPSKNMNDPIDVYVLDNGVMRRFTEGNAIFIQYPGETESFISFDIQGCTEHFRTASKDFSSQGKIDNTTLCNITDDDEAGTYEAYSKTESDGLYVHKTGTETITGEKNVNDLKAKYFTLLPQDTGSEGGEIRFNGSNGDLIANQLMIDRNQGRIRIFGPTLDGTVKELFDANFRTGVVSLNGGMPTIKAKYVNGTSGYRIWTDGYCEQWGEFPSKTGWKSTVLSFIKEFKDISYTYFQGGISYGTLSTYGSWSCPQGNKTTKSIQVEHFSDVNFGTSWRACGYLKEGQY